MNLLVTILLAVLIFGVIIIIHELGHFLTAKAAGVAVPEFSIGMGPKLFQIKHKETNYTLRLLPIGGYVAMEGEDEESDDERAFCNKKPLQKILVIAAGATMNLLLGFLIMVGITASEPAVSSTQIGYFAPDALSAQKLELDDEIISINGHKIHTANDLIYAFVDVGDQPVQMTVRRDGQKIELQDVPFAHEQVEGQTIVQLDFKVKGLEKTPLRVLKQSWYMTTGVVKQVWGSFGKLISGQYQLNQLSGPVGVTQMIGEVASARDYSSFFFMTAFITINIGVFNLLPLPALDGGRLLFLFIELLRGKPVPAKYEGFVHAAGLVLLMGLMLMVTFNYIVRVIKGYGYATVQKIKTDHGGWSADGRRCAGQRAVDAQYTRFRHPRQLGAGKASGGSRLPDHRGGGAEFAGGAADRPSEADSVGANCCRHPL